MANMTFGVVLLPKNDNASIGNSTSKWKIYTSSINDTTIASNGIASTSAYGLTKLYNGTDSTSTVLAATANSVKTLSDHIDTLDYGNAGAHNSIYRGASLGSSVTTTQWNAIKNGTFDDMYIGDYWTIGGNQYTICHFNYYKNCQGTSNVNHIVLMPRGFMTGLSFTAGTSTRGTDSPSNGTACWNLTDSTAGGYIGSHIRTVVMPACDTLVKSQFGSSHILAINELYPSGFQSTTDGRANTWDWTASDYACDLCNEMMVYGSPVWGLGANNTSPYWEVGIDKQQLLIFKYDPSFLAIGSAWWLRSVSSASGAARVYGGGYADYTYAAYVLGVRPRFCIYSS